MDIDALISKVYERRPIWDRKHKLHSNRNTVEKCWHEVSKELNADENALRRKWKYLRDQFSVELGKTETLSSTISDVGETSLSTKWPFYQSLLFLKGHVKPRQYTNNSLNKMIVEIVKSNECQPESSSFQIEKVEQDDETSLQEGLSSESDSVAVPTQSSAPPMKERKRNLQSETFNSETTNSKKEKQFQENPGKLRDDIDDDDMFFKSLLPHVRKIDNSRKMSFRIRVQQLVDEFVYQ